MENILQKKSSIYNIGAGWLILKSRGLCNIGFSKQKLPSLALLTTPAANVAKQVGCYFKGQQKIEESRCYKNED